MCKLRTGASFEEHSLRLYVHVYGSCSDFAACFASARASRDRRARGTSRKFLEEE